MEVYFDNSATTPCLPEAADAVRELLCDNYGNPSSMHNRGLLAEQAVRRAREQVAASLHVREQEIVFTSGGTEGNNLAVLGAAFANPRVGKHIITTPIEHPCVDQSVKYLAEQGFEVTYLPVDGEGRILLPMLEKALRPDTVLVSVMHVNNEIGTVEPVEEAAALVHERAPQALFHTDAVQSYGKLSIRPKTAGIDLLTASGHKIRGPKGSGFIYIRNGAKVQPRILGGGQERGLRSGTENTAAIAGLGVAAQIASEHLSEHAAHLSALRAAFIGRVLAIDGCDVNGSAQEGFAPHIVSVTTPGVRSEVLLHALEERGVYVSAGSACSSNKPAPSRTLVAIGLSKDRVESTIRVSFGVQNTMEEVEYAAAQLSGLLPVLRKYMRR